MPEFHHKNALSTCSIDIDFYLVLDLMKKLIQRKLVEVGDRKYFRRLLQNQKFQFLVENFLWLLYKPLNVLTIAIFPFLSVVAVKLPKVGSVSAKIIGCIVIRSENNSRNRVCKKLVYRIGCFLIWHSL